MFFAVAAATQIQAAQATCTDTDLAHFPHATKAAEYWAEKHSVTLPKATVDAVTSMFCDAALNTESQKKLGDDAIDRVAEQVIDDYLDLEFNPTSPMRSMAATLNNALGASGLARPVARRLSWLRISYEGQPHQLRIGSETIAAVKSLLVVPGSISVQGLESDRIVCSGLGEAVGGQPLTIDCKKPK